MSQYCMEAALKAETPVAPGVFQKIHCSQGVQPAAGVPGQVPVLGWSLLICSVYVLAIAGPAFAMGPLSLVTLTFSKCPIAWVMCPDGACAETSLPFPTTAGRGPCRGIAGMFGAFTHVTSFHSV